jgi:hypothetical protein
VISLTLGCQDPRDILSYAGVYDWRESALDASSSRSVNSNISRPVRLASQAWPGPPLGPSPAGRASLVTGRPFRLISPADYYVRTA